jgi:hypothetical protein
MDKMEEFLDKFKTILESVNREHVLVGPERCKCGQPAEYSHVADAQARKLVEFLWEK